MKTSKQVQGLKSCSIVMMGATGAVGSQVVKRLIDSSSLGALAFLGRRTVDDLQDERLSQFIIDIFEPDSYSPLLSSYDVAVCTLGVGQPSKMSREQWLRIDKIAVLDFARHCHQSGVRHFHLLTSIGSDPNSKSFFLRAKGELEKELESLGFESVCFYQPSMIITPTNRYGLSQVITLAVWPTLSKVMFGSLKKYRGIDVADLGAAIARNALNNSAGVRRYTWADLVARDN